MKLIAKVLSVLILPGLVGCNATVDTTGLVPQDDERIDRITDVSHTDVEDQTIGNCWIYATASMVESLHLSATGDAIDLSQSYWTYMHWFDQIVDPWGMKGDEIRTGGTWQASTSLIRKYGLMEEIDFVPADGSDESSYIQSSALRAVNNALGEGGELFDDEAKRDREKVRAVLDRAFGLSSYVKSQLDGAFGAGLERTFSTGADNTDTSIIDPSDFVVSYTYGPSASGASVLDQQSVLDAVEQWNELNYSVTSRPSLKRVQRALHDSQPVIITWLVDFNALETTNPDLLGSFNLTTWKESFDKNGVPGRQGGHMTVLEDYEAIVFAERQTQELFASVEKGEFHHFEPIEVSEKVAVEISMAPSPQSSSSEDGDLFVRVGSEPTDTDYDCRPYKAGSTELCTVTGPATIYVSVKGYSASSVDIEVAVPSGKRVLEAGVTLDPQVSEDAALLESALANEAEIVFFRIKNSWGTLESARLPFAPGPFGELEEIEKGYHDLYMDFLAGPIARTENCSDDYCPLNETPLMGFVLPPGY